MSSLACFLVFIQKRRDVGAEKPLLHSSAPLLSCSLTAPSLLHGHAAAWAVLALLPSPVSSRHVIFKNKLNAMSSLYLGLRVES